jgi:hypothetical protein
VLVIVVIAPDAALTVIARLNPGPYQTQTAVANATTAAEQAWLATVEHNDRQATLAAFNLQETQFAVQDAQSALQATQFAIQLRGTRAALDSMGSALDQTATYVAQASVNDPSIIATALVPTAQPIYTDGFANPAAGISAIDDRFAAGIDGLVWLYDPAGWSVQNGALTAQQGGWMLSQRSDFGSYVIEVAFEPPPDGRGDSYILLNVRSGALEDGQVALYLGEADRAISYAGLYYFTHNLPDGRFNWGQLRPITSLDEGLNIPRPGRATGYYLRVEVRANTFAVYLEDVPLFDMQLTGASTGGAVGLALPAGSRLHHVRVTPLQ